MEPSELKPVLEAIIYVAEDPVKPEKFRELLPEFSVAQIEEALTELAGEFNSRPGGMMIRNVAGGYRMTTRPEHHEHIRAYLKSRPSPGNPCRDCLPPACHPGGDPRDPR